MIRHLFSFFKSYNSSLLQRNSNVFFRGSKKHYLPADGVRQIVRPVFEVDLLLWITKQLLREGSVQVVIIAITTQSLIRNLT